MASVATRGRSGTVFLCALLWAVGAFRAAAPEADASPPLVSSEAVYAAFTINLTRFISWPENGLGPAGTPFVIGTFPRDPINDDLDSAVRGEQVQGHPIRTIRLHSVADALRCQVVYVSRGSVDIGSVLATTRHRPILTVSDADGFLAQGGHVRFVPLPSRTALRISAENLRASGLEARAQLLRLATNP